jgi:hypothetical protein
MTPEKIIERLKEEGVTLSINGARLRLEPCSKVPESLIPDIKANTRQLAALLQGEGKTPETTENPSKVTDRTPKDRSKYPNAILPFPLGFAGLPEKTVNEALAACEAARIKDPVIIWLRVYRKVMDFLKKQGDVGELYGKVAARYHELAHIAGEDTN